MLRSLYFMFWGFLSAMVWSSGRHTLSVILVAAGVFLVMIWEDAFSDF